MKKNISLLCLVLVACTLLMACAAPVTFQTSGAQYEILQMKTEEQALTLTASGGNTLFVMTLGVDDKKLDDAQNAFFSPEGTKASVSDGSGSYECKQMAFETNGSKTQAVLVFEVPAAFTQVKDFTLSGNGFGPVNLQK
ncbi:MAG: hypothetical protein VB081_14700 [Christensenella sp.]|uniref:hypothetical protein n=1 Tax=Christensenella sp. TaxID=1935934 RepID=UPI002B1EB9ED|nr:hypothetical protein [Christensenella sp.]MEA5004734.1 hypothetical protein [Christensenella sp.]